MIIDFSNRLTPKKVQEMIDVSVSAETVARMAADEQLDAAISAETQNRIAADEQIYSAISAETVARIAADSAETQQRIAADSGLSTEIENLRQLVSSITLSTAWINLSTAPADIVKIACSSASTSLFLINYSGKTYTEQYRESSGDSLYVYFYVLGAQADEPIYEIYDAVRKATININTGSVSSNNIQNCFAPNISYDLDKMNSRQIDLLSLRAIHLNENLNNRFSATWTYDNKKFVYSTGCLSGNSRFIVGTNSDQEKIYYDFLSAAFSTVQQMHVFTHDVVPLNAELDWPI